MWCYGPAAHDSGSEVVKSCDTSRSHSGTLSDIDSRCTRVWWTTTYLWLRQANVHHRSLLPICQSFTCDFWGQSKIWSNTFKMSHSSPLLCIACAGAFSADWGWLIVDSTCFSDRTTGLGAWVQGSRNFYVLEGLSNSRGTEKNLVMSFAESWHDYDCWGSCE